MEFHPGATIAPSRMERLSSGMMSVGSMQEEQAEQPDAEEILKEIRSVADVLKNPDVGYEAKGNLIRSVVEQIIYDKESGKMSFDIIIS